MNAQFWQGKRVFVTGHTGFKGGWLSLWLQQMGAVVTGYALEPPTSPNLFESAQVADGMQSIIADVCNLVQLGIALEQARPEIVIHMAAQPLVLHSYNHPVETYATNVMGTVNVLEAVRQMGGVRAVVVVTTDKCYENNEWPWGYRENEPMGGHDPYSSSKGCAELVTAAYRSSYFSPDQYDTHGVAVASARAGNVVGGGDWAANRLIPDFIRAMLSAEPVVIRSPGAIRPWQHVLEPLSGYLTLAERLWIDGPQFGEAWNFGPDDNDAKPVAWIVEKMVEFWGEDASWKLDTVQHPHEATYLKLDCSKAKSRLQWKPRQNLQTTLEWIVEWHKAFQQNQDMRQLTKAQIARYQTMEAA